MTSNIDEFFDATARKETGKEEPVRTRAVELPTGEMPRRCCARCWHIENNKGEEIELIPPMTYTDEKGNKKSFPGWWVRPDPTETRFICREGGLTEIGDPYKALSKDDCNAWRSRLGPAPSTITVSFVEDPVE